jgi:hypothetical protein
VEGGVMPEKTVYACSVYAISDGHGNMKVGVAKDIQRRIKVLQIGNAHPLQLLFEIECLSFLPRNAASCAYRIEHWLHSWLEKRRMTGEWFAVDYDEALGQMVELVATKAAKFTFEHLRVTVNGPMVHIKRHEHIWYWPTSDVYERGLVQ